MINVNFYDTLSYSSHRARFEQITMAGVKRSADDAGLQAAKKHKPDNAKAGHKSNYSAGGREYSKHSDGKKYDWKKGEKKWDGKTQNGGKPEIFHGMRPAVCSSTPTSAPEDSIKYTIC